jgi:CBS domain containing-hemolysin-like protein
LAISGLNVHLIVVILVGSLFAYAFTNGIEIAIVAADRIRIRHLADEGSKAAQAVERLRFNRDAFFAAIVFLQNLFATVTAAMASVLSVQLLGGIGLLPGTLITTLVIAVLGDITPKIAATRASERYALLIARPFDWMVTALKPVLWGLAAGPRAFSTLVFHQPVGVTPTVTEAELRMLIDIGTVEQAFGERTGELLEGVFQFRDRQVQEIMVPRTEVVWLEAEMSVGDFFDVFSKTSHSRFPVYRDSIDNVVGVVGIKDVLRGVAQGELDRESSIEGCMRPTYFVPETKPVGALFAELQASNKHMAVVVDEYGGTAGMATIELLLEEMVGTVSDELAHLPKEFQAIDEKTVQVDGGMSVSEANQELGLSIPEGRYETVAGYVLSRLGHIPSDGERVEGPGFTMVVAEMRGIKIEQVLVTRK